MMDHLTTIRSLGDGLITAQCAEHGPVGRAQRNTRTGLNAVVVEARGHDDVMHYVYREDGGYRAAVGLNPMSHPRRTVRSHG